MEAGLGLFNRLPREVCEMIWECLMPQGETTLSDVVRNRRNMSILRVSRPIYYEVVAQLYEKARLSFNLSPNTDWASITYQRYGRHWPEHRACYKEAMWTIDDPLELYARGFFKFPFHRLRWLEVITIAPDSGSHEQMNMLWRKTVYLYQILSRAVWITNLMVLHFAPDGSRPAHEDFFICSESPSPQLDLSAVFACFLVLPNVSNMYTRLYERDLNGIRWKDLDWETLTDTTWQSPRTSVAFKLIYTWMQLQWFLWNKPGDNDHWGVRAQWVATALRQYPSPFIEFHKRYWQLVGRYPGLMEEFDAEFSMINDMHLALTSLYHYATGRYHDPHQLESIKPEHAAFRFCPLMKVKYDLGVESRYREYMRLYGYHYEPMPLNYAGVKLREQVYAWCG